MSDTFGDGITEKVSIMPRSTGDECRREVDGAIEKEKNATGT